MKKLISIILALLLGTMTLFSIAGCDSNTQNELQGKINDLQSQIDVMENRLAEMDWQLHERDDLIEDLNDQIKNRDKKIEDLKKELYGSYNEAGGFYELDANNYISVTYRPAISSVYCYRISVEHTDENLIFLCHVESGHFTGSKAGKTVELKSGEFCHWGFDTYPQESWDNTIYVDIFAKNGDQIIGYGIIGISSLKNTDLEDMQNSCKVLKFAVFPQVEGKYQTISENQVKKAMDEIKNLEYETATDDEFYTLLDAYYYGWLTRDDLMSIAYYHNGGIKHNETIMSETYAPAPKTPEVLSEETELKIKTAAAKDFREIYPEQNAVADDFTITEYYGTYGDCAAIMMKGIHPGGIGQIWTDTIAGVNFYYISGDTIQIWRKL